MTLTDGMRRPVVALAPDALNGTYSGSKAYVVNFTQALKSEVEGKGVMVQALLPGATATSLWENAGRPVEHLPSEIVMTGEDMVDASLAGLDQHEQITIPSLPDIADWEKYEAARKALGPNLSRWETNLAPFHRYLINGTIKHQKVNRIDNCACNGSPTPRRRKPLKSNNAGDDNGLILFALLKALNNSALGII